MNPEQLEMVDLPFWYIAQNTDGSFRFEEVDRYDGTMFYHHSYENQSGWINKHFLCGLINRKLAKIITNPLEAYALGLCVKELQ